MLYRLRKIYISTDILQNTSHWHNVFIIDYVIIDYERLLHLVGPVDLWDSRLQKPLSFS